MNTNKNNTTTDINTIEFVKEKIKDIFPIYFLTSLICVAGYFYIFNINSFQLEKLIALFLGIITPFLLFIWFIISNKENIIKQDNINKINHKKYLK